MAASQGHKHRVTKLKSVAREDPLPISDNDGNVSLIPSYPKTATKANGI